VLLAKSIESSENLIQALQFRVEHGTGIDSSFFEVFEFCLDVVRRGQPGQDDDP
jgi:hypothetical protein